MTTPVKGTYFLKWLHAGLYQAAADLECFSCEHFLTKECIQHAMRKRRWCGYVVTDIKKPVGYVLFRRYTRGRAIHLMNIVVHPDYRCTGIGTMLLDRIKEKMDPVLFPVIHTMAKESNLGVHLFLQRNGFVSTTVERDFYSEEYPEGIETEDAYVFKYELELK